MPFADEPPLADEPTEPLTADEEPTLPVEPSEVSRLQSEFADATTSLLRASSAPDDVKPAEPVRMGPYALLLRLTPGGMAHLHLACRADGTGPLVVLKQLRGRYARDPSLSHMLADEAHIAGRLQHPGIATLLDVGQHGDQPYLAMEYVHGQNLAQVMQAAARSGASLDRRIWLYIVAEVAQALHAAHELRDADGALLGVVHRDVSPANILIGYDGQVKVIDFGIVYARGHLQSTRTGVIKGKAAYLSPEQITSRDLDRRSDVFSLGVVLYELVLGVRLFREADDAATMSRILAGDIPRPRDLDPSLSPELEAILLKALALQREARYRTARELGRALQERLVATGPLPTSEELATQLEPLLGDERRRKEALVAQARERLRSSTAPDEVSNAAAPPGSVSTTLPGGPGPVQQRGITILLVVLVGALIVAVLSLLAVLYLS